MRIAEAMVLALSLVSLAVTALCGCAQDSPARERGARVYALNCLACHGENGAGSLGPELTGEIHHKNQEQTVAWIKHALPPMPRLYPFPLSDQDVEDVATFVTSL